jgi:hypothetical protein
MEVKHLHKVCLTRGGGLGSKVTTREIYLFATDGADAMKQASEIVDGWNISSAEDTVANVDAFGSKSPIIINANFVPVAGKDIVSAVGYMSDNTTEKLFEFNPGELHFTSGELIGLSLHQAKELWHQKDVQYIRRKGSCGG